MKTILLAVAVPFMISSAFACDFGKQAETAAPATVAVSETQADQQASPATTRDERARAEGQKTSKPFSMMTADCQGGCK